MPDIKDLPNHLLENAENITKIALVNNWHLVQVDTNTFMLGFKKSENKFPRINVYLTKMTFVTQIDHPTKGRNQLFRRGVRDEELIYKIFDNPRVHTSRGYHKRKDRI